MAWNEIYRGNTKVQSESFDLTIGTSGADGTATIEYYTELVVWHDWSTKGTSKFKAEYYLNVISVLSPIKLYLTNAGINVYMKGIETSEFAGPAELAPGSTYSNINLYSRDMSNSSSDKCYLHDFEDGKLRETISTRAKMKVYDTALIDLYTTSIGSLECEPIEVELEDLVPIQEKGAQATTADSFTDETTNPTVSFSIFNIGSKVVTYSTDYSYTFHIHNGYSIEYEYPTSLPEHNFSSLTYETYSLQIGMSMDGETLDVPYRDASLKDGSFTFNLTEAELDILRMKAQGSDTVPIYYMFKTTRKLHGYENPEKEGSIDRYKSYTQDFYTKAQRNFTVIGCNPTLNPTVKDIKPETLALTGDENTFIRYESMAEFAINATASKYAEIVSQSVTCGSKTVNDLPYGVIDDVESGIFNFYVTDSRNMGAASAVFKNLIEYVKPTCYQKAEIAITDEVGATIKLMVSGNYFNGSFGAADNTLTFEVRHTDNKGVMGEWTAYTVSPTFDDNMYEIEILFEGFSYGKVYKFQSRITDKLNYVESSQYVVSMKPVFDWSETDFNFNVPINIEADNLDIHGETIIRHNEAANNTVLSASGGHIYIRPGGTDETDYQTILYPNGNVEFSGDVNFGRGATFSENAEFTNSLSIKGNNLADYVIATGQEGMGGNGIWYWQKWASGKAECWGCRNYGNMAVSTSWGNLYRSAIFTQDLPEDVFITTPDVININIVNGNFGGWICKHEQTAPSAITTGSFIWVRPASATISPTYIGFHVIGVWKQ